MSPVAGTYSDASDEACIDSRKMLQEAIISARKELEAAKISACAELDAKQQQLLGIRQEAETSPAEPPLEALQLATLPSPQRVAAEQRAMVDWESQDEVLTTKHPPIQVEASDTCMAPAEKKDTEDVPPLRQKSGMSNLEERLMFGAGPHCEGSRSLKKHQSETPGLLAIETIQAEHQAQRESWTKALAAHEEELMKEREQRTIEAAAFDERLQKEREVWQKEAARFQEELEKERSARAQEAAMHREEKALHKSQGVEQLAEERERQKSEFAACKSELAKERELRCQQALANSELQTLLEKSTREVASLKAALIAKEAETGSVEQTLPSSMSAVSSASSTELNFKPGTVLRPAAKSDTKLALRLFEGDAPLTPPSRDRKPKWPAPAPAASSTATPADATDESANTAQGSVLKRVNALEVAKRFESSSRSTSQPPPSVPQLPLGAKPNFYQEASEATPRGKVSNILHQLECRVPAPIAYSQRSAPSTPAKNPSWMPEHNVNSKTSHSTQKVRWVRGSATPTPPTTSSLVRERVRRLENGCR